METNIQTGNTNTSEKKHASIRVYRNTKKRLQKVVREKAVIEDRVIKEVELANKAIASYCTKEEKKLGIKPIK
jgi:hypothetical protein